MFTFTKLFATMYSKKRKTVSSIYGSQLHQCWTHKRFLQLKSIAVSLTHTWHKIGPKSILGRQTKTTACLKQSTLGICIRTSISLQCKLLSKELWICFANERIPINPWNLIVHGLYFLVTTFFQSGIFIVCSGSQSTLVKSNGKIANGPKLKVSDPCECILFNGSLVQ